jgi:hypothetical protein
VRVHHYCALLRHRLRLVDERGLRLLHHLWLLAGGLLLVHHLRVLRHRLLLLLLLLLCLRLLLRLWDGLAGGEFHGLLHGLAGGQFHGLLRLLRLWGDGPTW